MPKSDIRLIAPCAARVSESPVWDASRRQLHFVDIYRARIGTIDWANGALSWLSTPEPVGCVGPAGDDHFAAGLASGMALIERSNGRCTRVGSFSIEPGSRLNDGRCAPGGRHFWWDRWSKRLDRPGGHLYRVDAGGGDADDGVRHHLLKRARLSPDGRTMFHADPPPEHGSGLRLRCKQRRHRQQRLFCAARAGEGRGPTAPRSTPKAATERAPRRLAHRPPRAEWERAVRAEDAGAEP